MFLDLKYLFSAVVVTLALFYAFRTEGSVCRIVITGESAVVHNCPITEELAGVLKYLYPAEHRSL